MITRVRYEAVSEAVYRLASECGVGAYPVCLRDIVEALKRNGTCIELDTYESFAEFIKKPVSHVAEHIFLSKEGATALIAKTGLFIIFYASQNRPSGRINWTIAHELGHILLNHHEFTDAAVLIGRGSVMEQYPILEQEADQFAKALLCNTYILSLTQLSDPGRISSVCDISRQAAQNRINEIIAGRVVNKWDMLLAELFRDFVYKRACLKCGHVFIEKNALFCSLCGSASLKFTTSPPDEPQKHNRMCQRCSNSDISGSFCKICGLPLTNTCAGGCGGSQPFHLPEYARFCCLCGSKTSYGAMGFL